MAVCGVSGHKRQLSAYSMVRLWLYSSYRYGLSISMLYGCGAAHCHPWPWIPPIPGGMTSSFLKLVLMGLAVSGKS